MYYNPNYNSNKEEKKEEDFVVSDMSAVERPSLFGIKPRGDWKIKKNKEPIDMTYSTNNLPPVEMTKEERKWFILGTLKAAILVSLAYIVGLTLVIILLLFFMN